MGEIYPRQAAARRLENSSKPEMPCRRPMPEPPMPRHKKVTRRRMDGCCWLLLAVGGCCWLLVVI